MSSCIGEEISRPSEVARGLLHVLGEGQSWAQLLHLAEVGGVHGK